MVDEKRIKEAEKNVRQYMEDNLLTKISIPRKEIADTYKRNYKESFEVAQKLFDDNMSSLWAVVTAYYSMYYIANAVIYGIGYKIGAKISHKVTADALIVFVRNKLKRNFIEDFEEAKEEALDIMGKKADEIILSFDKEREKRSVFQYETTEEIKRAKAKTSLERAKKFIFEMAKLL